MIWQQRTRLLSTSQFLGSYRAIRNPQSLQIPCHKLPWRNYKLLHLFPASNYTIQDQQEEERSDRTCRWARCSSEWPRECTFHPIPWEQNCGKITNTRTKSTQQTASCVKTLSSSFDFISLITRLARSMRFMFKRVWTNKIILWIERQKRGKILFKSRFWSQ